MDNWWSTSLVPVRCMLEWHLRGYVRMPSYNRPEVWLWISTNYQAICLRIAVFSKLSYWHLILLSDHYWNNIRFLDVSIGLEVSELVESYQNIANLFKKILWIQLLDLLNPRNAPLSKSKWDPKNIKGMVLTLLNKTAANSKLSVKMGRLDFRVRSQRWPDPLYKLD